ncbi:MAG: GntR family transcriptional regulator [Planctomycetes bacterium]|nr:GntR family transcriptional regulator [Planctomycetota bacterium]
MADAMTRRFAADELKDDIRERIEDGRLHPGEPIAGISTLADRYDIAYGTARNAIRDLVGEGILTSKWGKGTFVAPEAPERTTDSCRFIALGYPLGKHPEILHQLQETVTERGATLTLHNASEDNQCPEMERKFLENIQRKGFQGVGVFATPVPPTNVDYYRELRSNGMKVALLAPPAYDVSQETIFLPNHRRGGYLVVRELERRGFRNFVFLASHDLAVYKDWMIEGGRHAGLETDATVRAVREGVEMWKKPPTLQGKDLVDWLSSLNPNTAVLACKSDHAAVIEEARQKCDAQVRERLCVASCFLPPKAGYESVPRVQYDMARLLEDTIDYLLEDDIPADVPVQRWEQPVFVPGYLKE